MPDCPVCFGEKGFDLRDSNALLSEHLTDEQLALVVNRDVEWWPCDECEATGVVTEERAGELAAAAVAAVDQAIAEFERRQREGGEPDEAHVPGRPV